MINLKGNEFIRVNPIPFSYIGVGNNPRFFHKLGLKLYRDGIIKDTDTAILQNDGTFYQFFARILSPL